MDHVIASRTTPADPVLELHPHTHLHPLAWFLSVYICLLSPGLVGKGMFGLSFNVEALRSSGLIDHGILAIIPLTQSCK